MAKIIAGVSIGWVGSVSCLGCILALCLGYALNVRVVMRGLVHALLLEAVKPVPVSSRACHWKAVAPREIGSFLTGEPSAG